MILDDRMRDVAAMFAGVKFCLKLRAYSRLRGDEEDCHSDRVAVVSEPAMICRTASCSACSCDKRFETQDPSISFLTSFSAPYLPATIVLATPVNRPTPLLSSGVGMTYC